MPATWRPTSRRNLRPWAIACGTAATMLIATAGPALMQGVPMPRASDGQNLGNQNSVTQASFVAVWGDDAGPRWVAEHEAELARQRSGISLIAPPATNTRPPAEPPRLADLTATAAPTATSTPVATATSGTTPTSTPSQPSSTPTATGSPVATSSTETSPTATNTPGTSTPGTSTPVTGTPETSTPATSTPASSSSLSVVDTPRPTPTLPATPTARGSSFQSSYLRYPGADTPIGGTATPHP